jgi:hypothetical protein
VECSGGRTRSAVEAPDELAGCRGIQSAAAPTLWLAKSILMWLCRKSTAAAMLQFE